MSHNALSIEIFSAPACNNCGKAFQLAEKVLAKLAGECVEQTVDLRQVNIVEELDYAVALGVIATPSIVINGELIFTSIPTELALREAIQSQREKLTLTNPDNS